MFQNICVLVVCEIDPEGEEKEAEEVEGAEEDFRVRTRWNEAAWREGGGEDLCLMIPRPTPAILGPGQTQRAGA